MIDLGLRGRKAIVCASSKGLGKGCAWALAQAGVTVIVNARGRQALEVTVEEIRSATAATVVAVASDVTTEAGREALLAACPDPDILVTNAGGPPHGDFREWTRDDWIQALDANMLTPIALIRATVDGMIARRFGRIVDITSIAVKAPIPTLGLSNAARSGLTGFVAGLARQVVRYNVTINNLLPGSFDTDRLRAGVRLRAERNGEALETVLERDRAAQPAGRFGTPEEFGLACAFLCAEKSGFITGHNLLIDGGYYPGTL